MKNKYLENEEAENTIFLGEFGVKIDLPQTEDIEVAGNDWKCSYFEIKM